MTLEEFNLAKEFFINKSIDRGYVALEEYNEFIKNMDKDQIDLLISDIEKNSLQILSDIEIFQNKLNSNGKKLAFSYYLFVCKVLKTKPSVKEFKPRLVHFQKHLIDVYLCEECSLNEKNIIRLYYGLDNGIPEKNLSNIKELLKYECDSQFINDYHKALSKLENGYVNYYQFALALESVIKYYSMDTYRFCKIAMEDGEEASMFSPLKNGEEHYGGYYAYYLSDGARQLGWILKPGYFAHNITFYDGDCWGIRTFNERKRPNLNIHYEDGKLYFEFYYYKVGYQGYRYIFEANKQVTVQQYNKGKLEKEFNLDFVLNTSLDHLFTLDKIEEKCAGKIDGDNYSQLFTTDFNDGKIGLTFTSLYNGYAVVGQTLNGKYNGLSLVYGTCGDKFRYQNNLDDIEENKIKNSAYIDLIDCEGNPKLVFCINSLNNTKYEMVYNPFASIDQMCVIERTFDGTLINKAVLSNPFFKKATNQEHILETNEAEKKLNNLIGLKNVKEQIKRLKAICHKNSGRDDKLNLNMVFTGNPGTGKTVVARLVANILHDEGILPNNTFIEVDRSGLVAEYIGQSEKKVSDLLEKAKGGVLFIDEAYSLFSEEGDSKDYGQKIVDLLVKAMEDMRGQICIIFAGYDKPMQKLLNMNVGFKSRVNRTIEFPDYSIEELKEICNLFLEDNDYECTEDAISEILSIVELKMKETNFDNARCIRNILESLYEIQSVRTYDDLNNRTITIDDVNDYKNEIHFIKKEKNTSDYVFNIKDINDKELKPESIIINEAYLKTCSLNIKNYYKNEVNSEGTGFFISSNGLICTCAHVIDDECDDIRALVNIETNSGKIIQKEYQLSIVAKNSVSDVGLLKINNPDIDFNYYLISDELYKPALRTEICMAGYPLGGERFKDITINDGKIQSYNKDAYVDNNEIDKIYVDMQGVSGNSGSGVLDYTNNMVLGIFAGASLGRSKSVTFELNYCIPTKYIWDLIKKL